MNSTDAKPTPLELAKERLVGLEEYKSDLIASVTTLGLKLTAVRASLAHAEELIENEKLRIELDSFAPEAGKC